MNLSGLSAIVTGGASGMGKATAQMLLKEGAKVALVDVNETNVNKTAKEINSKNTIGIACDVTNTDSVEAALVRAYEQQGIAQIVVNCAGIVHSRRMVNKQGPIPLDEFRRVIEINLIGTFNVMRLATAEMLKANASGESQERGVIINTASIAAFDGQIGQMAYSASKGGIVSMTLPAARELAQFGIRVMTIAPGLVDTPMFAQLSDEARASLAATVPFPKRLANPLEFAALVRHIIENPMLNGEVIRLDGALRMQAK